MACAEGAVAVHVLQLVHRRRAEWLDVLIANEAHRIREKSANRWTKASLRSGKAQVDVPDVSIDDWSRPWNLRGDRSVGGAPPAPLWASDPAGFGLVGCVYTAQGFEYDWNGVIIGPDLVWRGNGWTVVRSANKDPDFRNRTKVDDWSSGGWCATSTRCC